jgi:glycosyltransferase involved in cell wall biosynthesis
MKICSYSILNDEIDYIKDVLPYHLSWLDGMFILDTGSTDGTLEYLKFMAAKHKKKIVLEEYKEKYDPQYHLDWHEKVKPFEEVSVRNFAINRCEETLKPEWIVQLDGDEVWLPRTRELIEKLPSSAAMLGCSTINPVGTLETHPNEKRGGYNLFDPHIRLWKAGEGIEYFRNPAYANHANKDIHCIPRTKTFPYHLFHHPKAKYTDEPINFHLHYMFGRKLEAPFLKNGETDRRKMIEGQGKNKYEKLLPAIFWKRREEWLEGKKLGNEEESFYNENGEMFVSHSSRNNNVS